MGNSQSNSDASKLQHNKSKTPLFNIPRFINIHANTTASSTSNDLKVPVIRSEIGSNKYQLKYSKQNNLPISYALASQVRDTPIGVDSYQSIAISKSKPLDLDLGSLSDKCRRHLEEIERVRNDINRDFPEFQDRIKKNRDNWHRNISQESHNIRLEILKKTTDLRFNQHTTTRPELSVRSTISLKTPLESYKIHDKKYFPPPREFPELTPQILEEVRLALVQNPPNEVLVEIDGAQILRKDIQTLYGLNWLNDEIINAYMTLLCERSQQSGFKRCYSFNTFFYPKLASSGYTSVKRWTRRIDLFSYQYVIVPVHLGNHWCLAFIDFTLKTVSYFDSMGGSPNKCCDRLLTYLKEESMDKKKQEFDDENWRSIDRTRQGIPQQTNFSDCGVFACTFAEYLTRGAKFNFTQKQMPYFRKKMVYEIIKKKILE